MEEEKRPKTRRNNTKAVEKLYQKKRRLKKQAARLRNTKKTDGSAAEEGEEGGGQFSDSDFQHDLPAAEVKQHQTPAWHVLYTTYPVVEEKYPLALTFSKTSTWLAMEDHPFSNRLTEAKWEALKKQPRDDNPLEERYGAAPFKIDLSHHLLAGLLQVVGVLAPSPCRTCENDCGRWATCVISYDHSSIDIAKGACANCLYTSAGQGCSFRDSSSRDTADTDTNPELKELEGKGFPSHFAAREAIKQAQQHNGYQIVTMSGNLCSGRPKYQKYRCFRYDDLTSGGVKIIRSLLLVHSGRPRRRLLGGSATRGYAQSRCRGL